MTTSQVFSEEATTQAPAEAAAADQEVHELRYKFKAGEVVHYEVAHRASIRTTMEQVTQSAQTKTDSLKAWKVTDVLPNGDIEFTTVVERVHMVNQLPDKDPMKYDSAQDKTPPPGFEDAARSVGVPLSIVRITPQGKIVRRDWKVKNQNIDEDAPAALRLPEKAVAVGDTWDEPFDVQVTLESGGSKSVQTRRHHKLKAVTNGVATIQVTYQVLSPIDAHIECQLVQKLMEGEVRFDIEAGRILGQQMDIDKRIIGFAGPTSSMHYVMRMEEKLAQPPVTVADKRDVPPIALEEEPAAESVEEPRRPSAKPSRPAPVRTTRRTSPPQRSQSPRPSFRR